MRGRKKLIFTLKSSTYDNNNKNNNNKNHEIVFEICICFPRILQSWVENFVIIVKKQKLPETIFFHRTYCILLYYNNILIITRISVSPLSVLNYQSMIYSTIVQSIVCLTLHFYNIYIIYHVTEIVTIV